MAKYRNKQALSNLSNELDYLTRKIEEVPTLQQAALDLAIGSHLNEVSLTIACIYAEMQKLINETKKEA
tara:strand:+ start:78 stop:284 length:207 start_codon:yes stop_codon:yes gene_type:complete